MGAIKYLLLPSFVALILPIILAMIGLVDFADAGAWSFYIMILVIILNATLYKKIQRLTDSKKQPILK